MQHKLEGNFWKYTVLLIANKRAFVAIIGAYYLTIPGVTPQVIGTILMVSSLAAFVFEIPSGYLSDKFGHKETLVLSRIFMVFSTFFFLISENVWGLMLAGVMMSIAQAFTSGTGSAFVHETLRALGREADYSRIAGKMSAIGFAVPVALMMAVPFLVSYSYKLPFLVALVIDSIGLLVAFFLVRPPTTPEHVAEVGVTNFRQVMREGHRLGFLPLAFYSGSMAGILFAVAVFRAPYQLYLEIPVIWFGIFFGIGRILTSVMLAYSGRIAKYFTLVSFYRFKLILYTFLICTLGLVATPWVVVIVLIISNAFTWGLSKIGEGFHLEVIRESKFKATLLSVPAQINEGVAAFMSFGLGVIIERFSYQAGFLVTGIVLFAVLFPLYLFIASRPRFQVVS